MKPIIDFEEGLKDSPKFRNQLQQNEMNLDELEIRLEKMIKLCQTMSDGGRSYVAQQTQFLASLWEMSSYFATEKDVETTANLNKLIHGLQEMIKFQNTIVDQAQRAIGKALSRFLKEDVKQMKDTKGYFNKISTDLDSALNKNAAASKNRPNEVDEATNLLTATKSCFRYTTLDYVSQISMLQSKKEHEVLESLLSTVVAYGAFFHQGSELSSDLEPFLKVLGAEIGSMRTKSSTLQKQLERRHAGVTDTDHTTTPGGDIAIEGYLFKRGRNTFRTWNRRWFYLQANQLCYAKRSGEEVTVMEEDLRICLVRPLADTDRRFCFEIISPTKHGDQSHVLQADSEETLQAWVTTLKQSISTAFQETLPDDKISGNSSCLRWEDSDNDEAADTKKKKPCAKQILLIPGNECCCDCGQHDPEWASINLGVTLCIECSGVHRGFGVHISKVRSITLDAWEPEILKVMAELGNDVVNRIYEAKVDDKISLLRARADSPKPEREAWIRAKYVDKHFVDREALLKAQSAAAAAAAGKWTVRRLRRRARTASLRKRQTSAKEQLDRDEKDEDTCAHASSLVESDSESLLAAYGLSGGGGGGAGGCAGDNVLNAETVLFGESLGKHHVANIELDSDQESTDGEDEAILSGEAWDALTPDRLLFRGARAHNLPVMAMAMALDADRDWTDPASASPVVHQSMLSGSVMAAEFLLLNGARINAVDAAGNGALHLAAQNGSTGQVCLLLKHRADHHLKNTAGQKALDIAVQKADADIVTVLRLAALNEEIRDSDMGGADDTFNDVVQEFSQMVYTHPERLHKRGDSKK